MASQIIFTFNNKKSFIALPDSYDDLYETLKEEIDFELENDEILIIKDENDKIISNNNQYLELIENNPTPKIVIEIKKNKMNYKEIKKNDIQTNNTFHAQFERLLEDNLMKLKEKIKEDKEYKIKQIEMINSKVNQLLNNNELKNIESKITQFFNKNNNTKNQYDNITNEIQRIKNEITNESNNKINNQNLNKIPEQLAEKIIEINLDINKKFSIKELINKNNIKTKNELNKILEEIKTIPNAINNIDNNNNYLNQNLKNFNNIIPIQSDKFNIINPKKNKKNQFNNIVPIQNDKFDVVDPKQKNKNHFNNIIPIQNENFNIKDEPKSINPIPYNDINFDNNLNYINLKENENYNSIPPDNKNKKRKLKVKLNTTNNLKFTLYELRTQKAFINVKVENKGDLYLSRLCSLTGNGKNLYIDSYLIQSNLDKNNIKEIPNIPIKIKQDKQPKEKEEIKLILYNEDKSKKLDTCKIYIEVLNLNEKIEIPKKEYKEGNIHELKKREEEEKEEKKKLMQELIKKISNDDEDEKNKKNEEEKKNEREEEKKEESEDDQLEESEDDQLEESEEEEEKKEENEKVEEKKEEKSEVDIKNDFFKDKLKNLKEIFPDKNDEILINTLNKCKGNLELAIEQLLN